MRKDGELVTVLVNLGENGEGDNKQYVGSLRAVDATEAPASASSTGSLEAEIVDTEVDALCELVKSASEELTEKLLIRYANQKAKLERTELALAKAKAKHSDTLEELSQVDEENARLRVSANIAERALDLLIASDEDSTLDALRSAIQAEVQRAADSPNTLFRENDVNMKRISAFLFVDGATFLRDSLAAPLATARSRLLSINVADVFDRADASSDTKSKHVAPDGLAARQTKQARYIGREFAHILKQIERHVDRCPSKTRELLQFMKAEIEESFSLNPVDVTGSFWFLRFFVPAVVNPEHFGLVLDDESAESDDGVPEQRARVMALLGQLLQCMVNGQSAPRSLSKPARAVFDGLFVKSRVRYQRLVRRVLAAE
jgi:GTPase-activator protein for Ras-like GTPase